MWNVTIDCVSIKEINLIEKLTNRDAWNGISFCKKEQAEKYAAICKDIAPLCWVSIEKAQ